MNPYFLKLIKNGLDFFIIIWLFGKRNILSFSMLFRKAFSIPFISLPLLYERLRIECDNCYHPQLGQFVTMMHNTDFPFMMIDNNFQRRIEDILGKTRWVY